MMREHATWVFQGAAGLGGGQRFHKFSHFLLIFGRQLPQLMQNGRVYAHSVSSMIGVF